VAPGDVIFSFVDARIAANRDCPVVLLGETKPAEFGETGRNWENVGWMARIQSTKLFNQVRPKDHIEVLKTIRS